MKPVAIIGMSSIFPQAEDLTQYWDNILGEINCITEVPASRWEIKDYYDPNPDAPDKSYCKYGGFIPDIDFDPAEFGLPPNILEATDVSQLLALVAAKECLEDGGYGDSRGLSRENVGVILGMVGIGSKLVVPLMARLQYPVWDKVLQSYGISENDRQAIIEKIKLAYPKWGENSFPGSIGNVVAGRIANRFDLGGTNCVVDAACASSLAAIRMAVGELIEGRADMMISGGVDTDNSIGAYLCFSKTPAFSKGEHVRSFDKDSDGMMIGEGIGMVLLKRLEDAQRDGDRVYAVIKGMGTSSDGRFKSIYAPRPDGQSLALRRAYADAGFSPSTVGLIEAHGTGTMAGDPAEFQGLNAVFSENDTEKQHIALGSVKSQIAHTKAAAGVASLIKAALALHNKVLPATINVNEPNPKLDIENTPFYLNTKIQPWIHPENHPRRAGVSSFGFGGTNFHVVLEENETEHTNAYRTQSTGKMILISAPSTEALAAECGNWINRLGGDASRQSFAELVVQSTSSHIPMEHARIGFVAINASEALTKLKTAVELVKSKAMEESAENPTGVYFRKNGVDPKGKIVALFPGQGSQYVNMGMEAAINFPEIRQSFAKIDSLFAKDGLPVLSKTVFPIPVFNSACKDEQNRKITATEFAQPAIGTLSLGFFKILQNAGFKPDFTAGHSFGELTALWAAGVYSDEDFYFLAKSRGKAMAPLSDPGFDAGTMLAVKGDVEKLKADIEAFPEIVLANLNSNSQVVLAGSRLAIADVQKALVEKGYSVVALDVSAAFHTPLVGHAQKPFAAAIQKTKFKKPKIPVFSNSTGKQYQSDPAIIQQILAGHILNPVNFKDEIEAIYAAGGSIFIEFGPKNVLTNLVNNILDSKPHVAIALNPNAKKDSDRQFRDAVTQLCVLGMELQNFDPYSLPEKTQSEVKKSSISVKLNGGLYLSEKTRTAFQNAINQQNSLDLQRNIQLFQDSPLKRISHSTEESTGIPVTLVQPDADISTTLSIFQTIQQETLSVHEKYLDNDAQYTRLFSQLTQQELGLINGNSPQATLEQINIALQTLERSIAQFHQHQAETLRIHEQYLSNQVEILNNVIRVSQSDNSFPVSNLHKNTSRVSFTAGRTPENLVETTSTSQIIKPGGNGHTPEPEGSPEVAPPPAENSEPSRLVDVNNLTCVLLEIVSEKTGYPTEMLELTMDMEADLGIDSIKRVEILGAMQSRFPDLPKADTAALAEMRTLGQIVENMSASATANMDAPKKTLAATPPVGVGTASEAVQIVSGSSNFSLREISVALLEIVSEKTGYPTEMLEMGMDMEADLGIDSTKRVEILGAIQERFPELPKADAAILAEMRTLGQITEYMSSANPAGLPKIENPNAAMQIGAVESYPNDQTRGSSNSAESLDDIKQSLLEVVSEKTGYPTEMLELGMDLEADLGIDSIKRVEILGAMQEKYPDLPKADASALAELRTLQQIIDSFSSQSFSFSALEEPNDNSEPQKSDLIRGVISLKSLPLPDHLTIVTLANHVSLVVDDGSELTTKLAEKLITLGNKVVVLSLPEALVSRKSVLPDSAERVALNDTSEESIRSTLKEVEQKFGPAGIFIHLDPACDGSEAFSENEKMIVKTIFLMAKHLKENLTLAGKNGYAAFITAIRLDGQFGLSMSKQVEPVSGGLFGLTKTLNLEWEDVFCRAIDLHPEMAPEMAANCIIAELSDPNRLISEVAYNKNERFTLVVQLPESEAQS
ncbi:MAG: beta-ketoacyl synthase N-terminal-like domain-containing protein [Pelolinea sp.]|nr:beta-ketoacyl synthase N-terminal-like domain-containing protein [Pelolinea sp.]